MDIEKAKGKAEDLVVRLRELVADLLELGATSEWEEQKEQFKVIGESIQHLEQKNVPVPQDLRKLQNRLQARIEGTEKQKMLLYFLREQLSQVLKEIGAVAHRGALNGTTHKQAVQ